MSRHSRIVESLAQLEKIGAVMAHHREHDPAEPTRVRWQVQTSPVTLLYYTTGEVEAFIAGAEAAMPTPAIRVR
jgi:hypothetical protein